MGCCQRAQNSGSHQVHVVTQNPQLAPFDMKGQWLYSELSPDVWASHSIDMAEPSHPLEEVHWLLVPALILDYANTKNKQKKTITLQIWCTFQIAILTYDIPINQICKLKCIKIKWAAKETYIFCSFLWVSSLINDIIFTIGLSQQLTRSPDLFVICYILESQVVT